MADEFMSGKPEGEGYGLVLAFDSDDPEFCRGWEAGVLYIQLEYAQLAVRDPGAFVLESDIHNFNQEMARRMAARFCLDVTFTPFVQQDRHAGCAPGACGCPDWTTARFARPVPPAPKLRLVRSDG